MDILILAIIGVVLAYWMIANGYGCLLLGCILGSLVVTFIKA